MSSPQARAGASGGADLAPAALANCGAAADGVAAAPSTSSGTVALDEQNPGGAPSPDGRGSPDGTSRLALPSALCDGDAVEHHADLPAVEPDAVNGRRLLRSFVVGDFLGVVIGTRSAGSGDEAQRVWRVRYEDGDMEELPWHELHSLLQPTEAAPALEGGEDSGTDSEDAPLPLPDALRSLIFDPG
jgi:hypothetical protein